MKTFFQSIEPPSPHKMSSNALFVIGVGRSGTTLLYDLLCLSKSFRWFSRMESEYEFTRFLEPVITHHFRSRISNGHKRGNWLAPSEAYKWWDRVLPEWRGAHGGELSPDQVSIDRRAAIANRILDLTRDGRMFLNKNTRNSRRIELLASLPNLNSSFVHVVRHPAAVALSLSRVAWWPNMKLWFRNGETPRQSAGTDKRGNILLAAELWAREIELIEHSMRHSRVEHFLSRYEHIINDLTTELKNISEFVGVPISQSQYLQAASQMVRPSKDWNAEYDRSLLNEVWEITGSLAVQYGYRKEGI